MLGPHERRPLTDGGVRRSMWIVNQGNMRPAVELQRDHRLKGRYVPANDALARQITARADVQRKHCGLSQAKREDRLCLVDGEALYSHPYLRPMVNASHTLTAENYHEREASMR